MGWLEGFKAKCAGKQYANKLPSMLKNGWGMSEHYTPAQIKKSVQKLGLDPSYIALGFAVFLPKDQFETLLGEMPIRLGYEEAREIFFRFKPHTLTSASGSSPEKMFGGFSDHY